MGSSGFQLANDIENDACAPQASWLRALRATADIAQRPERTLPILLSDACERFNEAPALLSHQASLNFRELGDRIAHYAHWARSQDIEAGEAVCLLMPNIPDYLAAWLGITRVGGVVALLNTSLRGLALAHSICAVAPKRIIVHDSLLDQFDSALPFMGASISVWAHGEKARGLPRIDLDSGATRDDRIAVSRPVTISDRALYIFTSGTTGLPKAAIVSHRRVMTWSLWFAGLLGTGPTDRMYNCLPLYHSIGGIVATGSLLVNGGSAFLRDRFSASAFWTDVNDQNCTLFQYIGELCRYLLSAPRDPRESSHGIRLCCGNGLRQDVWAAFQQRFAIPKILEFYAATEGNLSLYNVEGKVGAIGRPPKFSLQRNAIALVKLDSDHRPLRDSQNFCVKCGFDEAGEALGRIPERPAGKAGDFEGYTSEPETERKILRNVFQTNDAWFRTGDLMRKDPEGFYYFVDRLGDTFRWKGENVSTLEVAEAICSCRGVHEAVVYGVTIPHADGKAGMALIGAQERPRLDELQLCMEARLPPYARPIFLRFREAVDLTETYKYKKAPLVRDGYDPNLVSDPLFYYDAAARCYQRLDARTFARILAGDLRW